MMWNKQRIETEHKLKERYGLKNLRELWRAVSELRRIRRNVREVLSGRATQKTGKEIISRLAKYDIVKPEATLDDILVVDVERMLDRRLESVVYKRGMARSMSQARQLIAHGFIAIDGKRVKAPSYLVKRDEESKLSYYKAFKLDSNPVPAPETAPKEAAPKEAAAREAPKAA